MLRCFYRDPGFAALAAGSLGAGLGLATALGSFGSAVAWGPLPVERPQQIARIFSVSREQPLGLVSFADFEDLRRAPSLLAAAAQTQVLLGVGLPARIRMGLAVSDGYFRMLGVRPALGRLFDERDRGAPAVVLAYAYWRAHPCAVGSAIPLAGKPFTVIGVAPAGFRLDRFLHEDFYVQMSAYEAGLLPVTGHPLAERGRRFLSVYARTDSMAAARAEVQSIAARLEREYPATNRGQRAAVLSETESRMRADGSMPTLAAMLGISMALTLAMGAVNAAALMAARAASRSRETAIRSALGATAWRLWRESVAESCALMTAGALAGIPAGWAAMRAALAGARLPADYRFEVTPRLDARTGAILLTAAAAFALICAAAPAWRNWKDRGAMTAAETAFAAAALAVCAMLSSSLWAARHARLGYRPEGVNTIALDPSQQGYGEARTRAFYEQLLERVRSSPGVKRAALAQSVPLGYTRAQRQIAIPGERDPLAVWTNVVTPGYFELMEMRILEGRGFERRDTAESAPVAVINTVLARRCGAPCRFEMNGRAVEVVGVVETAAYFRVGEPPQPYLYLPFSQSYVPGMVLHAEGGAIRETIGQVAALDPGLAVSEARPLADYVEQGAAFGARIAARVAALVGSGAAALAIGGIWCAVAREGARRRREMGIRLALGCARWRAAAEIARRSIGGVLAGAAAGSALAEAARGWIAGVSGVPPPGRIAAVGGVLAAAAGIAAAWMGACRMADAEPAALLKMES